MFFVKGRKERAVITAYDLEKNISEHKVILSPDYSKEKEFTRIVQPRGVIFSENSRRNKPPKF